MKAFIVLALVAATAARSLDVDTLRWTGVPKTELLKEKVLGDKLTTYKWNVPRRTFESGKSFYPSFYPYSDVTTGDYDVDTVHPWTGRRVTILSLDEIVSHPLFEVYYRLPYFRQFWTQYPTVFKKYIESPLFQQFWTEPEFQQYFVNPVLFYKYVVPQVQLFYRVQPFGTYYNNDVYDRDVVVGDYVNRIFDPVYTRRHSRYFPQVYNYNNVFNTEVPTHYNKYFSRTNDYKFILDKIYRTLFVNKPVVGETTEVFTDVKVAPVHKELVVDPITGEKKIAVVETPKIVDVKVDEKVVPTTDALRTPFVHDEVETDKVLKETLLKKLLIKKVITPELYTVLRTLPLHHVRELVHRVVPTNYDYDFDFDSDVYNYNVDPFVDVNDDVFYRHKVSPIVSQLWNKDVTGDRYDVVLRDLLKVLGHRNIQY